MSVRLCASGLLSSVVKALVFKRNHLKLFFSRQAPKQPCSPKPDSGCSPQWPPKEEGEGAGLQVGSQSCSLQGKSKEAFVLMKLRMGCYRYHLDVMSCTKSSRTKLSNAR